MRLRAVSFPLQSAFLSQQATGVARANADGYMLRPLGGMRHDPHPEPREPGRTARARRKPQDTFLEQIG